MHSVLQRGLGLKTSNWIYREDVSGSGPGRPPTTPLPPSIQLFPSLLCFVIRTGGVLLGAVIRSSARLWLVRTADISRLLTTLLHVYTQYPESYLSSRVWSIRRRIPSYRMFSFSSERCDYTKRSGKYALPANANECKRPNDCMWNGWNAMPTARTPKEREI